MSFPDGSYIIATTLDSKRIVNRSPIEDLSLLPKRIILLSNEMPMPPRPWIIKSDGNGAYIMKALHAPTAVMDNHLRSVLLDYPPPTSWKFKPVPEAGENAYTIMVKDSNVGWVMSKDEERTQVNVQGLAGGNPANQVFTITRVSFD